MSVSYFVSGVEPDHHFQWAYDAGNRNMLMSYLWIVKMNKTLASRAIKTPGIDWMIDSGAHTFQKSMDSAPYKTWTLKDFENYAEAYVKWLHDNRGQYRCAVELDIAYSINVAAKKASPNDPYGDYVVEQWRKELFLPLLKKGVDIIFVWHDSQGLQGWENLCATYSYVGLPGEMSSKADFNSYMTVAKRYTTRVHAFAGTKQSDFRDWPWFSLDSTSWKAGEIYGTLPHWFDKRQKLKFLKKGEREPAREDYVRWGLDAEKIINDLDYQQVTFAALKSYAEMEHFYEQLFSKKTFYYQLRLPHPGVFMGRYKKDKNILRCWNRFRPEACFPQFYQEKAISKIREWLHAISCVQYRELGQMTAEGKLFVSTLLPTHFGAGTTDDLALAREMSMLVSPVNEEATRRTSEDDFADQVNVAKVRTDVLAEITDDDIPDFLLDQFRDDPF